MGGSISVVILILFGRQTIQPEVDGVLEQGPSRRGKWSMLRPIDWVARFSTLLLRVANINTTAAAVN